MILTLSFAYSNDERFGSVKWKFTTAKGMTQTQRVDNSNTNCKTQTFKSSVSVRPSFYIDEMIVILCTIRYLTPLTVHTTINTWYFAKFLDVSTPTGHLPGGYLTKEYIYKECCPKNVYIWRQNTMFSIKILLKCKKYILITYVTFLHNFMFIIKHLSPL